MGQLEHKNYIYAQQHSIEGIKEKMPSESILYDLSELFKIFGESTRIKILFVLLNEEMCVYDISQLLNMSQSAISHQLYILKQSKLVRFRRQGKNVLYSLADEHVSKILNQGIEHVTE